jgi:3-deoxy-D-manno-octulosonate 8-phosphate phosphatase KdsC-like HAD superfamily phosphatase
MSRVDQQYWRRLMFEELAPSLAGPVCAIDVDGVLETGHLGYSSVTEAGAMALRSLLAHGYRPILVTGRSAGDVRDRCRSFGLPGGVAEYGAALYTARDDTVHDLRGAAELRDLEHLRSGLASAGDVHIHAGYRHAVRASLVTATGPRPLPDGMVRERLESLGLAGRVRIIQGWLQTDFMAAGIDKGTGLHALLIELGERDHHIALAVGDSPEDLPVMKMAALAIGPRNADPSLAAAGARVMSGSHQAGLAAAVGLVIGHRPGGCDLCRPGALSRDAELLLTALGAQQEGRTVKVRQALRLAVQVAGTR